MRKKERKTVKNASSGASQTGEGNDQEMHECLAKLKVWRAENLMSPTGMDRFAQDIGSKLPEKAAESIEGSKNSRRNLPISRNSDKHVNPARSI